MQDIKDFTLEELESALRSWDIPVFHCRQIFVWIYQRLVYDFTSMTDLPVSLRQKLGGKFRLHTLILRKMQESKDGTKKLLLELKDGNLIESVLIPAKGRVTGCISTQVGCRFACRFCASGLKGFKRNLTCGEILDEVIYLKSNSKRNRLTHLVFMGTGEPLDNYDNVLKAVRIINSAYSFNIGARKITVSTCGIIPGIKRLVQEGLQMELSISLHAADEKTRSAILPINKKYPLKELISACREYVDKTNRQITFEYILLKGINSDLQKARDLVTILKGLNCKVNLIPYNLACRPEFMPPENKEVVVFKRYLTRSGITVTLRKPRGEDIDAACGQLRLRYEKK